MFLYCKTQLRKHALSDSCKPELPEGLDIRLHRGNYAISGKKFFFFMIPTSTTYKTSLNSRHHRLEKV